MNDGGMGMITSGETQAAGRARIVLPGHADTVARVEVRAISGRARVMRTLALAALWGTITTAVFFITVFDPFMTSMPAFVGAASVYRSWRGRYQLRAFEARCPRCGTELRMKRNARVGIQSSLACYSCHHHPGLVFA